MRRSIVLDLPLQLVFHARMLKTRYEDLSLIFGTVMASVKSFQLKKFVSTIVNSKSVSYLK